MLHELEVESQGECNLMLFGVGSHGQGRAVAKRDGSCQLESRVNSDHTSMIRVMRGLVDNNEIILAKLNLVCCLLFLLTEYWLVFNARLKNYD